MNVQRKGKKRKTLFPPFSEFSPPPENTNEENKLTDEDDDRRSQTKRRTKKKIIRQKYVTVGNVCAALPLVMQQSDIRVAQSTHTDD